MACSTDSLCKKGKILAALITLAMATFDLGTDWWAFKDFVIYRAGKLMLAFGFFCVVSTLLYLLELRNGLYAIKVYRSALRDKSEVAMAEFSTKGLKMVIKKRPLQKAEKHLTFWQEMVSFLLLVLEDLPVVVILYVTFNKGSCPLFLKVFEESSTGNWALIGMFLNALWKVVLSFCICCCRCCNYHDLDGVCRKIGCCCLRLIRPTFAIVVMAFALYLFFNINARGIDSRPDCIGFNVTHKGL